MDKEENLDLLDLEDSDDVDTLPDAAPFTTARPKKPWLLMGLGVAIIVLATWIIVARIGGNSGNDVSIDLGTPVENVANVPENTNAMADLNVPEKKVAETPQPVEVAPVVSEPKPVVAQQPVSENGNPVRVVNDRKEVTFNPDKVDSPKTVTNKPVAAPVKKAAAPTPKPVAKASNGSIYVQFGSYGTREAAQSAERKMRTSHASLFNGKQFVILAANVKGQTKYRLRVAFHSANEADGFCKNAKSDGLDCYVTK